MRCWRRRRRRCQWLLCCREFECVSHAFAKCQKTTCFEFLANTRRSVEIIAEVTPAAALKLTPTAINIVLHANNKRKVPKRTAEKLMNEVIIASICSSSAPLCEFGWWRCGWVRRQRRRRRWRQRSSLALSLSLSLFCTFYLALVGALGITKRA